MGEVLQGPWGTLPGDGSAASPPAPEGRAAAPDDAATSAPAAWAVPGLEPQAGQLDADAPVPLPSKATQRAQNVSLAALTSHDASEAELRARLMKKGLESAEVDVELRRLQRSGLVDDRALADRLIERLRERKGLGDGALRGALRQRLIPADVVDAALAEATQDPAEVHDRLQEVADERARRLGGLAPEVAERRLLAYLQRKGYSGSEARAAARAALRADPHLH